MGSIECVQGQAEGHRERPVLIPISEGIPQDILESFGVQEDLNQTSELEQSTQLYSGEMREFLPSHLGDLDWSSGERYHEYSFLPQKYHTYVRKFVT